MRLRTSGSPGFTLIELMVTIAVLAIVLAAATPSFVDFFDKYRLRGAVDDVVSLISNARAASVKSDRNVNISFAGASTTAWCLGANAAGDPSGGAPVGNAAPCDCADTAQCNVGGERMALNVGQEGKVSVNSLATSFGFNSKLGLIDPLGSASATFTSPRGKYEITVNINALGQASACTPATKPTIAGVASC